MIFEQQSSTENELWIFFPLDKGFKTANAATIHLIYMVAVQLPSWHGDRYQDC